MSESLPTFNVALRHLSADARQAGYELGEVKLTDVSAKQLRVLLESLTQVAPKVEYPTVPEMRITGGDQQFLVQVREGRVRFSSWSVRAGGCDLSPAQILATIAGVEEFPDEQASAAQPSFEEERLRTRRRMVFLVAGVMAVNVVTAVVLLAPDKKLPPQVLPDYRLLESGPDRRRLDRVQGTYETGQAEGDRRMVLRASGSMSLYRYAKGRKLEDEVQFTVQAADSGGRPALLVNKLTVIKVRDELTLEYLGDTYTRVQ